MESFGDLRERRAVIIGGSGGIGRAVAARLAAAGAEVRIHGRDRHRVASTVAELRRIAPAQSPRSAAATQAQDGQAIRGAARELARAEDVVPLLDELLPESEQAPDILVVAFGPILYASLAETSLEQHRNMLELNYLLPIAATRRVLPGMIDHGYGRLVLFGGTATDHLRGARTIPAYTAAKVALGSFVRSQAMSLGGSGVTINAISPDRVHTEYLTDDHIRRYAPSMPEGRLIDPAEVAALADFLVRPEAASINGQVLTVDQGRRR